MTSSVYTDLNSIEEIFENSTMFFGFAFVDKNKIKKSISELYKSFPREIVRKGKSYAAAVKLEKLCLGSMCFINYYMVFKPAAMNYIDEIYSSLPQDIKEFC